MRLTTIVNMAGHDNFYAQLLELQDGLSEADALKRCAKLILLLANHIGDRDILNEAISAAQSGPRLAKESAA